MMMAFTTTTTATYNPCFFFFFFNSQTKPTPTPTPTCPLSCNFSPIPLSFSYSNITRSPFALRCAAKQETGSMKKRTRRKKRSPEETVYLEDNAAAGDSESEPSSIPKPPAGFILDSHGRVLAASSKRIVTIVDSGNNMPLECVVRRVFRSSQGDDCMLLCPVDTPVQILKSKNFDGWAAVNDEEIEAIIPSAAYALAKIHMHLVLSGGRFTTECGVQDFAILHEEVSVTLKRTYLSFRQANDGEGIDGLPTEGIEITCFDQDGSHYMIYTPSDPLLFVAVKDENGLLKIADDDLLEDPAIIGAIDEETEFNALVEEESALLESLLRES